MGAILLKCKKCGRVYSIEKMDEKDGHQCICGEMLDKWSNYIGFCENENAPNKPLGVWKRIGSERPGFPLHHGDDGIEVVTPKNVSKKITIDVETGNGFKKFMQDMNKIKHCNSIPGFAIANSNGTVNVVPIISVDSKALILQTDTNLAPGYKEELEKKYTERTGIECIILDVKAKLAAVIDG